MSELSGRNIIFLVFACFNNVRKNCCSSSVCWQNLPPLGKSLPLSKPHGRYWYWLSRVREQTQGQRAVCQAAFDSWAAVGLLAHRGPVSTLSLQVCPPGQVLLLQALSAGRGGHTTWFQRRWHRRKAAGCFCVLHWWKERATPGIRQSKALHHHLHLLSPTSTHGTAAATVGPHRSQRWMRSECAENNKEPGPQGWFWAAEWTLGLPPPDFYERIKHLHSCHCELAFLSLTA